MEVFNPLISVIIPAFNADKYIDETIDSVINQSYQNIEVIVINDGSTDNTLEVLEKFHDKITVLTTENRGVSHARNYGVNRSKGSVLAFVDSDDIWLSDKLERQVNDLKKLNWSHCDSFYFGEHESGTVKRSDLSTMCHGAVFEPLLKENFITTSTVLIKKETFIENGGFDEGLEALEDWKLWLAVARKNDLAYVAEPLTRYRVYSGSTSRRARKMLPLHVRMVNGVFLDLGQSSPFYKHKNKVLANSCLLCSYIAEDASDHKFATYCAFKACLYAPLNFRHWKRLIRTLML